MLSRGCGLDWPLSRDEKKNRVIHLYSQELEATSALHCREEEPDDRSQHPAYLSSRSLGRSASSEVSRTRLSLASTADTECSSFTQQHCCGHGRLDVAAPPTEHLLTAIQDAVESATLKVLTRYPSVSSVRDPAGFPRSSSARFSSEEPRRSCSSTRSSRGSRHTRHHAGRRSMGRHTPRQGALLEDINSDAGEEGDTEFGGKMEHPTASRNSRRSWLQSRHLFNPQRSWSVPPEGSKQNASPRIWAKLMLTPPLTPRKKSIQSPSTPCKLQKVRLDSPPPPPPSLTKLMKALVLKSLDEVNALLDDDPNMLVAPIKASGRIEPLLFCCLRTRCPVNILNVLFQKHPLICESGSNALIFLVTLPACSSDREMPFTLTQDTPPALSNQDTLLINRQQFRVCHMTVPPLVSPNVNSVALPNLEHSWQWNISPRSDYEFTVAALLLRHGVDPFEKDSRGYCAVDYASQVGKPRLAEFMQNWSRREECRLQCRLGILGLTDNVNQLVYTFLLPSNAIPG